jgi:hypothetical protein
MLSSFAVISYTENRIYVLFAAVGSWLGAFASMTFLHRPVRRPHPSAPRRSSALNKDSDMRVTPPLHRNISFGY